MELDKLDTSGDIQQLLTLRDRISGLRNELTGVGGGVEPKVDLLDVGDAYRLIIEVPGVPQDNLEVALQGEKLIVAGLREPHEDTSALLVSERPSGPFQRVIDLPGAVERETSSAHLREGLLILHLPKA